MKSLVTGGAGFIGSNLADRLLLDGHEVVVVDNLTTGRHDNVPRGAEFHALDIRDRDLRSLVRDEDPDVVFHLAAHIDVRRAVADPGYDADINLIGTLNLLEACRDVDVRKIVYAGTGGALFGEPDYLPVDEDHPVNPISPYGVSKHTVEHYLFAYRHNFGLEYTVLRYPNVYGPRQDPHGEAGVVAIFSLQLLRGDTPTIFGDGTKTRDYCYVGDIVEANLACLEAGSTGVYNLGRGVEVSDREVFDTVRDATGATGEPAYAPRRPGEVEHIALDASRARAELGWEPTVAFADGVELAVRHYREHEGTYR